MLLILHMHQITKNMKLESWTIYLVFLRTQLTLPCGQLWLGLIMESIFQGVCLHGTCVHSRSLTILKLNCRTIYLLSGICRTIYLLSGFISCLAWFICPPENLSNKSLIFVYFKSGLSNFEIHCKYFVWSLCDLLFVWL